MAEIKIVYSGGQGPAGEGVPTGGTAGQVLAKIDGTDFNTQWVTGGGAAAWGAITGTLSSQIDLQSALDAKAASSHTHAASDITSGTFADARIAQSNVTQFQSALVVSESQISDLGSYLTDLTGSSLSTLSDVTITTIGAGEVLKWDGAAWINNTLAEAGIATSAQGTLADSAVQPGDNISTLTNDSGFITTFNIVDDTTPQLGGNLDVQANSITTSTTNGGITLTPNGTGDVTLGNFVFDGDQTVGAGQDDYVLTYDNATGKIALEAVGAGSGEVNTASNVGTAGVGVYKTKVGADLQFKKINAGSSKVTITDDTGNDEIDIDIVEANITITESQISDLGSYLTTISGESLSTLSDVTITANSAGEILKWDGAAWINNTLAEAGIAASSHTHAASDITSGTFADARIAQTNVTQYQSALVVSESQISDLKTYQVVSTATVQTTDATSTTLIDIAIPTGEEKIVSVKVHGHEDATNDHVWKKMEIGAKNVAGTVSIVGGVDSAVGYDAGASAWTITASASTSNIRITVTGEAAHTIDWRAHVQLD